MTIPANHTGAGTVRSLEERQPAPGTHAIADLVEGGGVRLPLLRIVGLCFLLMICDSFDVSALSYAAPSLIRAWSLTPAAMGWVFSAGLFGLLVGSILLGRLGDRIGRKRAIVLGALGFSLLTAATGLATDETQLLALRFLAAVGLGGAVPNAVALVSEFSPRSLRVTAVGAIFAGYSIGGILAGVAATILPTSGWQMMFFLGGGLSLAATLAFAAWLPESLRYLASWPGRAAEAARVAAYLRPDLAIDARTVLTLEEGAAAGGGRLRDLFMGPLARITPLIWLIYIASSMTVFFLVSWMPVAVGAIGRDAGAASVTLALLFAGSAVGGVVGGRIADRFGILAVVVMALAAFPAVGAIGLVDRFPALLFPLAFLAGCLAFGGQTCLHGLVGSLYPTSSRANGVGWAIGIAKIGSILGPLIGGFLLTTLSSGALFIAAGAPLLAVAGLGLVLRATQRHRGAVPGEAA